MDLHKFAPCKYVTEERIYGKDGKLKFAYQKQVGVGGGGAVNN